jgi:hypothetical protein
MALLISVGLSGHIASATAYVAGGDARTPCWHFTLIVLTNTNLKNYCYNYEINLELCRGEQANVGASKRIAPTDA